MISFNNIITLVFHRVLCYLLGTYDKCREQICHVFSLYPTHDYVITNSSSPNLLAGTSPVLNRHYHLLILTIQKTQELHHYNNKQALSWHQKQRNLETTESTTVVIGRTEYSSSSETSQLDSTKSICIQLLKCVTCFFWIIVLLLNTQSQC